MRWVSLKGKSSLEKMISEDICLTHVPMVLLRGKLLTCVICLFAIRTAFNLLSFAPELDFGKTFWTATKRSRMSLNGWSMGWMSKNSLSPLKNHLWVSSMRARKPRLEFLRTTILANSFRSLLRKQFCNVSSQERSVFGVKWVKWHRPTSSFPWRSNHKGRGYALIPGF